jgi:flagellar basal-body rod protein FlgF
VANVSTTGYKQQREFYRSVSAAANRLAGPNSITRAINDYGVLGGSAVDVSNGTLERTGNDLDVAIEGPGFFEVQTKGGVQYTRNGSFRMDAEGYLTAATGERVLGEAGPILLTSDPVTVTPDGTITQRGAVLTRLAVVNLDSAQLVAQGAGMFSAGSGNAQTVNNPVLHQRMLESSNQSPVSATVQLIMVQRQAGLLQRAFGIFNDDLNRTAAEIVSRV